MPGVRIELTRDFSRGILRPSECPAQSGQGSPLQGFRRSALPFSTPGNPDSCYRDVTGGQVPLLQRVVVQRGFWQGRTARNMGKAVPHVRGYALALRRDGRRDLRGFHPPPLARLTPPPYPRYNGSDGAAALPKGLLNPRVLAPALAFRALGNGIGNTGPAIGSIGARLQGGARW